MEVHRDYDYKQKYVKETGLFTQRVTLTILYSQTSGPRRSSLPNDPRRMGQAGER